jgi:hypothetical protein
MGDVPVFMLGIPLLSILGKTLPSRKPLCPTLYRVSPPEALSFYPLWAYTYDITSKLPVLGGIHGQHYSQLIGIKLITGSYRYPTSIDALLNS